MDDLSSLSNTHIEIRDSGARFCGGGADLIVTVIATTANLILIADILYNWINKKKQNRQQNPVNFIEETNITIILKNEIHANIENLSKQKIAEVLKGLLEDKDK